ncbi:hypothetical protein KHC33_12180 [Methanospirillum sp. J.3.6.1-F.2.7.3]|uniref:SF3 helicase domain-containing protein n=2 Tax=Methanospirillum purgamenti TaxID=2834276 RepID=A0A8E7AZ50_9EURY|nr:MULTISPECIES: DUF5906 domain-containing protein [Methanospirillum]MDX8550391.1 DUF5906 domain-containing protein [Methanospirillum hungatei]QVV88088.1 hypothetical protein KHC33_12180 [Methanospirillum sp. J.3.6.1-F.2.7.3]
MDHYLDYPFNPSTNLIPVLNGVIEIDFKNHEITLREHEPRFFFTYCIPVEYNPSADSSFIDKAFTDWLNEDAWVLYQIPAQAILQASGHVFKLALLFIGGKDAGKSTSLDLFGCFFGNELIGKVDFEKLTGGRFDLSQLEGKVINLADDQPAFRMKETGTFKKLTGSARHNIEKKYATPYVGTVNPVYIFSANGYPKLPYDEDLGPFLDRFIIVTFDNKFAVNPDFMTRLLTKENLSGFLNRILEEIIRIVNNDYALRKIERDVTNYELWVLRSEPLYRDFVMPYFEKDDESIIPKKYLYGLYNTYCEDNDLKKLEMNVFFRVMKKYGFASTKASHDGKRIPSVKGWRYNGEFLSDWSEIN